MNKPNKPANLHPVGAAAQRPLTEEEKKVKIMQFLQQKREGFAINILCNLCHNIDQVQVADQDVVDIAVKMADKLIEKLYPLPEETDKSNE